MAFNNVAIDQGRVTRIELFRYRLLALEIGEVFAEENFRLDFETILLQMADPAIATISGRSLIDRDRRRRGFGLREYIHIAKGGGQGDHAEE